MASIEDVIDVVEYMTPIEFEELLKEAASGAEDWIVDAVIKAYLKAYTPHLAAAWIRYKRGLEPIESMAGTNDVRSTDLGIAIMGTTAQRLADTRADVLQVIHDAGQPLSDVVGELIVSLSSYFSYDNIPSGDMHNAALLVSLTGPHEPVSPQTMFGARENGISAAWERACADDDATPMATVEDAWAACERLFQYGFATKRRRVDKSHRTSKYDEVVYYFLPYHRYGKQLEGMAEIASKQSIWAV